MSDTIFPTQDSTTEVIQQALKGFGGILRCRYCGKTEQISNVDIGGAISGGWPRCCEHTMEWITQRQINGGYLNDPDAWLAWERGREGGDADGNG